jgi:hypothetical protein
VRSLRSVEKEKTMSEELSAERLQQMEDAELLQLLKGRYRQLAAVEAFEAEYERRLTVQRDEREKWQKTAVTARNEIHRLNHELERRAVEGE